MLLRLCKMLLLSSCQQHLGKIGRVASEEVVLQLIKSKCVPVLLYGLEACALNNSQIASLDFVINRFFMKLFNTNNIEIVKACQECLSFELPSQHAVGETCRTRRMATANKTCVSGKN